MKVTFNGDPITLEGNQIKVGDTTPNFTVMDNGLKPLTLNDTKGKRIFVAVPSVDTSVCDMEIKRFNKEAANMEDVTVYVVSMDLPFAQVRWCGNEGIDKVITVSDYKDRTFGKNYGTYIKEFGFLTRAIFVVDENNKVKYVEYCNDVIDEPNYDAALEAARS